MITLKNDHSKLFWIKKKNYYIIFQFHLFLLKHHISEENMK